MSKGGDVGDTAARRMLKASNEGFVMGSIVCQSEAIINIRTVLLQNSAIVVVIDEEANTPMPGVWSA